MLLRRLARRAPSSLVLGRGAPARAFADAPFDHVKTEREIGELQRSVRDALGAQDVATATEASEALMALARESYGEERNPVLAAAYNDAALCVKAAGDYEAAGLLLARSVQAYETCGMGDHASTATSLHNMGVCYKEHAARPQIRGLERAALLDRAAEALEESVLRRERSAGFDAKRDAPALATTQVIRASVLRLSKKPDDAADVLDGAISSLRAALAHTPVDTIRTALAAALNNKALYAKHDGDADNAAGPLYAEALALREAALGAAHPLVIQTLHNIAEHLDAAGDDDDANGIREEILRRLDVDADDADEAFAGAARAWAAKNAPPK